MFYRNYPRKLYLNDGLGASPKTAHLPTVPYYYVALDESDNRDDLMNWPK